MARVQLALPEARLSRQSSAKLQLRSETCGMGFGFTGQFALHFLLFTIAGQVVSSWATFGGLVTVLTDLTHRRALCEAQSMETSRRYEKAQKAAPSHLAREGGKLDVARDACLSSSVATDWNQKSTRDQKSDSSDRARSQTAASR